MDYKAARKSAFRILSLRTFHSAVLHRKLERKGFPPDICAQVVQDCKRLGLLSDDEVILHELKRGHGPRYIEYKLCIDKAEVRKVISKAMQKEQIRKMLPKLKEREKAMRSLQRRGFDLDCILEIFS
jgi:SOS response regulatory protein OraA/RecX